MASSNAFLRETLRNSLHDVLNEVSFDSDLAFGAPPAAAAVASAPVVDQQRRQSQIELAAQSSTASKSDSGLGLLTAPMSRTSFALPASQQVRPSAALGITTEELMLAAATERRLLEEKAVMMELEKARMAAAMRQRALQQALEGRRQQNQSLLGFFHQGLGMPSTPQDFSALPTKLVVKSQQMMQPKDTLKQLGTSLRERSSPYIDVSDAADPDPNDSRVKKTRGGVTEPFPERLHRLLKEIADDGNGDVISFLPHGRAFAIHKPDRFVSDIINKYFKQKSLSSFQRQLNLYGFKRISGGRDAGAYYHELFLQGRPNMCLLMRRVGLPKGDDRRKMRSKNIQVDPDFYSMKPVATPSPGLLSSC